MPSPKLLSITLATTVRGQRRANSPNGHICLASVPAPQTVEFSAQADHILLLDSFFYLVIFHGTTVASWRKNEYHLQPEHAAFAELLAVSIRLSQSNMSSDMAAERLVAY